MTLKHIFIFNLCVFNLAALTLSAVEVKIHFPPSGSTLSAGARTFVAGCVKPANSKLTINGKVITPYRTGSFVYMQTIKEGRNVLNIESGKYKSQHSFILKKPVKKSAKPAITPLFPTCSAGVLTNTTFQISCKAPAGSNPKVKIGERIITLKQGSSTEMWSAPLSFHIPLNGLPVTFFAEGLPDVSAGLLTAFIAPQSFKVTGKLFSTRARSAPDSGDTIAFLMPGDIVTCYGFNGNYHTMRINGRDCYVNSKHLKPATSTSNIKPDTPPADITSGFGPHPPRGKRPKNMTIALDPGHGGSDSGAIGASGLKEKEINLKQVKLLEKVFKKAGYKTILTRETDVYVDLYDRVRTAYYKKADAFISIHYNSSPSYSNPCKVRHIATYTWNDIGKNLAKPVHAELAKISPARDAGVRHGNFAVCRNPAVPSILIELDFITSPEGEELIQTAEFQTKTAEAILKGLQSWHQR